MTDMTTRRLPVARWVVAALTAFLLLAAVGVYASGKVSRPFADLAELTAALLGAVSCGLAAWSASGRLRFAWAGLAGASLSWAIGMLIWSWYELVAQIAEPFPGLADVGYLGFPIGAMVALVLFPSNLSEADRRRMTLDGLPIASAMGLVSWATALGAVVHAGAPSFFATACRWPTRCQTSRCWSCVCWCYPGRNFTGCRSGSSPQGLC